MLAPMKITFNDGRTVEVKPKASDGIRFEREFNMPVMKAFVLADGIRMEHLWFFAFVAYGRDHDTPSFDEWIDTVDSVDFGSDDEAETVPLDPTP